MSAVCVRVKREVVEEEVAGSALRPQPPDNPSGGRRAGLALHNLLRG